MPTLVAPRSAGKITIELRENRHHSSAAHTVAQLTVDGASQ